MHSASFDVEHGHKDGGDVLVSIAALVTEGRIPEKLSSKSKEFQGGPHCPPSTKKRHQQTTEADKHKCDLDDKLCSKFENVREKVLDLWKKDIPVCVEVLLTCACKEDASVSSPVPYDDAFLLEKWTFAIKHRRGVEPLTFNFDQLMSAIRSQLYYSQLTAWLQVQDENPTFKITNQNLRYLLTIPGETFESAQFSVSAVGHEFPLTDLGNGCTAYVSLLSLPRMETFPKINCRKCEALTETTTMVVEPESEEMPDGLLENDRMPHTSCTLKGKHRCEDFEEFKSNRPVYPVTCKKFCQNFKACADDASTSSHATKPTRPNQWQQNLFNSHKTDLKVVEDKGKLLLDAIERSGQKSAIIGASKSCCDHKKCVHDNHHQKSGACCARKNESSDNDICDNLSESDNSSIKGKCKYNSSNSSDGVSMYVINNNNCDSSIFRQKRNVSAATHRKSPKKRLTFDNFHSAESMMACDVLPLDFAKNKTNEHHMVVDIPTPMEQAKFRKDLDNAASMVFHSRTGLPLTSSPAPVRRGKSCFDFDSSINSVSAIKSALFPTSFSTDDESESDGSIVSPCSPETNAVPKHDLCPIKYRRKGHAANLLGSFEESVLNGRLEPVSTVHGFSAELGASGSFVPKHLVVPVTVFFYTLGDNDKVASPYLCHINLGKKGYNVPKQGTVQVTLFNPLGTVVKMFVIMFDLNDMPPNSQTFIRQRTLYMPANCKDENVEWGPKWLRFLIHLRFLSSKSGKIYLHSDIRMIIFRKSDMDTATAHGIDMSYELRSFTHMPTNPKYSPRK